MQFRRALWVQTLERRVLLAADSMPASVDLDDVEPCIPHWAGVYQGPIAAHDATAQYTVNQPPRIQLGNAPLSGTPADTGLDQIEILWQTVSSGSGDSDRFLAQLRRHDESASHAWTSSDVSQLDTNTETRIIHSAVFTHLEWDQRYEYQVTHYRGDIPIAVYSSDFRTRIQPGNAQPFSFAAYGDSAILDERLVGFRSVQRAINDSDAAFSVLLGDNIYDSGTHREADARFDPELNPEAAEWNASQVDYLAIGNHDFYSGGQASRDSFSMPIPEQGQTAWVAPPPNEHPEFFSSFEYGNVQFVTFDSNSAEMSGTSPRDERLSAQVEFIANVFAESTATWKILYMHHPIVGSLKLSLYPNTNYFEILVPKLVEAGVDLIMSGDSHTYAWSYPIEGWSDTNGNDEVGNDEVNFNASSRYEFSKSDPPVHLITGTGGKNVRNDPFGQPFMAQTHSTHPATLPVVNGFAHVRVESDALTVQYRSAETGLVVGDENGNGLRDDSELHFAEFQIVDDSVSSFDFTRDGVLDAADLDVLCAAILGRHVETDLTFDINDDGSLNEQDHESFVVSVLNTTAGDANLDGQVNSRDLVAVFQLGHYEQVSETPVGWSAGDWNCDGQFTSADLVRVFQIGAYRP